MDCSARMRASLATAAVIAASMAALVHADSLYDPPSYCDVERAGNPRGIARWAKAQNPCQYDGYYVGGGAWRYKCDGRCCQQGTWGWDYTGHWLHPLVRLGWTQPPRRQGGTGSYEPDGPRPLEELSAAHEERMQASHHEMHASHRGMHALHE